MEVDNADGVFNNDACAEEPEAEMEMEMEEEEEAATALEAEKEKAKGGGEGSSETVGARKSVVRPSTERRVDGSEGHFVGEPVREDKTRRWPEFDSLFKRSDGEQELNDRCYYGYANVDDAIYHLDDDVYVKDGALQYHSERTYFSGVYDGDMELAQNELLPAEKHTATSSEAELNAVKHLKDDRFTILSCDGICQDEDTHRDSQTCIDNENIVTQIFVNVCGSHISMQENLNKLSVKMLVQSAFKRVGVNANDFYSTCSGKYLDAEKLLSYYPIQTDSTIKVQHRLRAGRDRIIACQSWDQVIFRRPRFHVVPLPAELIDTKRNITTATFLSDYVQYNSREVLIALCRIHFRGFSLNGAFNSSHILFHDGKVIFDDDIPLVPFTLISGRNDYGRIYDIVSPIFWDESNKSYALHCEHLLNFLWSFRAGVRSRSEAVISYLTNHVALLTFIERLSICTNVDSMIYRLAQGPHWDFLKHIRHPQWYRDLLGVPAMRAVYFFGATRDPVTGKKISTYFENGGECAHFARNFFKHAAYYFTLEQLEAAFSLAMQRHDYLPALLEDIVVEFINPPPPPEFDVVKLLGNKTVDILDEEEQ